MSKKIEVPECPECGRGMVWTFAFPYNEYACLPCGTMDEFCCRGSRIEVDKQANERKKVRWDEELHVIAIRNGAECIRKDCEWCGKDEDRQYKFKYYLKNVKKELV